MQAGLNMLLPPVALLHGWGGSFADTFGDTGWNKDLADAGRMVIAITLPGHGPAASADAAEYADLASSLASLLPSGPIDIVGFSLGAKLALALACADPARVRRVVLGGVGDNLFAPEPNGEVLAGVLLGAAEAPSAAIAALARYALANGNDPAAVAAVLRRRPNPVLAAEDLPDGRYVLLVNGTADAIAMPDDRLRAAMPRLGCLHIDGCDHLSLPGDPRFREAALRFLG